MIAGPFLSPAPAHFALARPFFASAYFAQAPLLVTVATVTIKTPERILFFITRSPIYRVINPESSLLLDVGGDPAVGRE